jgi:hypothetical protein
MTVFLLILQVPDLLYLPVHRRLADANISRLAIYPAIDYMAH